jgi:hypothetical protein
MLSSDGQQGSREQSWRGHILDCLYYRRQLLSGCRGNKLWLCLSYFIDHHCLLAIVLSLIFKLSGLTNWRRIYKGKPGVKALVWRSAMDYIPWLPSRASAVAQIVSAFPGLFLECGFSHHLLGLIAIAPARRGNQGYIALPRAPSARRR